MLNLLIEAVAASARLPALDTAAFARQRNAARKLHRLAAMLALPAIDRERLSAVGRVRACLFHCDGTMHSPAIRADLATAAEAGERAPADGKLALTSAELAAICDFYGAVAAGLLAAAPPAPLTFRRSGGMSALANVACDGI